MDDASHGLRDSLARYGRLARRLLGWAVRSYLVVIVLGIVIGLQVAPALSGLAVQPDRGTVAVVPIQGGIDGTNAASVASRLQRARNDPAIDAVVLRMNSPGGGAAPSETMYLQVKRAAEEMPVVASVDSMAASGGYYAIAPADRIYVKPTSAVGSVGVITVLPQDVGPVDGLITSGPNKIDSADRREWFYKSESLRRAFVSAVVTNRNDTLELSRTELSYAKIYYGAEAIRNGMADEIGGLEAAIRDAADRAGLDRFRVRVLGYDGTVTFLTRANYVASNVTRKTLIEPRAFVGRPGEVSAPNPVMLPRSVVSDALSAGEVGEANETTGVSANGTAP